MTGVTIAATMCRAGLAYFPRLRSRKAAHIRNYLSLFSAAQMKDDSERGSMANDGGREDGEIGGGGGGGGYCRYVGRDPPQAG